MAASAARVRPAQARVTQPDLDRADGVNVLLLGHVIHAFRLAHGRDSSIPLLAPIATRRLFVRKTTKAAQAEANTDPAAASPAK